jgi:hypothetical protein
LLSICWPLGSSNGTGVRTSEGNLTVDDHGFRVGDPSAVSIQIGIPVRVRGLVPLLWPHGVVRSAISLTRRRADSPGPAPRQFSNSLLTRKR